MGVPPPPRAWRRFRFRRVTRSTAHPSPAETGQGPVAAEILRRKKTSNSARCVDSPGELSEISQIVPKAERTTITIAFNDKVPETTDSLPKRAFYLTHENESKCGD